MTALETPAKLNQQPQGATNEEIHKLRDQGPTHFDRRHHTVTDVRSEHCLSDLRTFIRRTAD
jgi:hypothetical protein